MAVQWTVWRELTCLSSLELKTLHITETATKGGTFIGRGQGSGARWRNKYCCAFNCWQTKRRTSFVRHDGKTIQKFQTKPRKNIYSPHISYRICTKLPNSCLLVVVGLGTETVVPQAGVIGLGQKLMGEVLWPMRYKRSDKTIMTVPLAFYIHESVIGKCKSNCFQNQAMSLFIWPT